MKNCIVEKMPLEIQMLWHASKMKEISFRQMREELKSHVRNTRNRYKSTEIDRLALKLENYGNEGGWCLNEIKRLANNIFQDKAPQAIDLGEWVSAEIELIVPNQNAETAFVSFVRKNGYSKMVTLKDDHSIKLRQCQCEEHYNEETDDVETIHEDDCENNESAYGREIVLTFKYGNWDFVKVICNKLNSLGCTVNKTCGLHVHFDMRHLQERREMGTLAHRLAKVVPALKQMLPASRQNNKYCQKVINKHTDSANGEARYAFVNVKSWERHKTLEVRGHSGTTDANKIVNWIRILRTVMAKPNRSDVLSIQALIAKFKFDADLVTYMLERQAKFAKVSSQQGDDVARDNRQVQSNQQEMFTIGTEGSAEFTLDPVATNYMATNFFESHTGSDQESNEEVA